MKTYLFMLQKYEELSSTQSQQEYIDSLEQFIIDCRAAANKGEELAPDAVYDTAYEQLRALRPESEIFSTVWSEDSGEELDADIDSQLVVHPMMSIQTIKDLNSKEFKDYEARITALANSRATKQLFMHASLKENGHGIRFVYRDGYYVKAHTRGRSSNGRDITRAIGMLVPEYIPELADLGIVEIRGELVLPYSNLDAARKFKPEIKSAFTGVSAMIRESASDAEVQLLRVIAYAAYSDAIEFERLSDVYEALTVWGFEAPYHDTPIYTAGEDFTSFVESILGDFEGEIDDYDYFTDGVVLSVNNLGTLEQMGTEKTTKLGNIALKVGFWKQDMYSAVVEDIQWKEGRSKLTPVAKVSPTLTANGGTVTNVPLYAPIHILRLQAYPGNTINFRYGGEAGVVPCFPDGRLVTDAE